MKVFETTAITNRENFYQTSELDNASQLSSRRIGLDQTSNLLNPSGYGITNLHLDHTASQIPTHCDQVNEFQTNLNPAYNMSPQYSNQETYYNTFLSNIHGPGNVKNGFKVTKNFKPKTNQSSANAPATQSSHKRYPQNNFLANLSQWDINDPNLPKITNFDTFNLWPQGNACFAYNKSSSDTARRHGSGWAMRNTNNHNTQILKKSCLGVLLCTMPGCDLSMRPAICDKARHRQEGRACPKPSCRGRVRIQRCRGHEGYPVTHFWRECGETIYFQAKGTHDHIRPDIKPVRDTAARRRKQQELMQQQEDGKNSENKQLHTISVPNDTINIGAKRRASKALQHEQPSSGKSIQPTTNQPMGPDLNDVLRMNKTRKVSPVNQNYTTRLAQTVQQDMKYSNQISNYQAAVERMSYFQTHQNGNSTSPSYGNYFSSTNNLSADYNYVNMAEYPNSNVVASNSMMQSTNGSSVQNASWSTPSPPNGSNSLLFDTFQSNTSMKYENLNENVTPMTSHPVGTISPHRLDFPQTTTSSSNLHDSRETLLRTPPTHDYFASTEELENPHSTDNMSLLHRISTNFNKSSSTSFTDHASEDMFSPNRKFPCSNLTTPVCGGTTAMVSFSSSTPVQMSTSQMESGHCGYGASGNRASGYYSVSIPFHLDSSNGSTDSSRSQNSESRSAFQMPL